MHLSHFWGSASGQPARQASAMVREGGTWHLIKERTIKKGRKDNQDHWTKKNHKWLTTSSRERQLLHSIDHWNEVKRAEKSRAEIPWTEDTGKVRQRWGVLPNLHARHSPPGTLHCHRGRDADWTSRRESSFFHGRNSVCKDMLSTSYDEWPPPETDTYWLIYVTCFHF